MSLFLPDDPDLATLGEDLDWPLRLDGNGDLGVINKLDNLRAAIIGRAITSRGEIRHRPNYGVDFEESQNAPNTEEEHVLLEARLLEQYQREDRLLEVDVETVNDVDDPSIVMQRITGIARTGLNVDATVALTRNT